MDRTRSQSVDLSCSPRQSMYARGSKSRRNQRGAVAITVALLMSILLGFAALAIDVGYLFVVRNELQNAADAAALAGAPCIYPRAQCSNTKAAVPDWATAQAQAVLGVSLERPHVSEDTRTLLK
ncbi:hypothetical protein CPT_Momento_050 [Burkholderia phage Momento]|uniref:Putative Flp pilus-assembly TadG-like N-terminal domain-containing protein n=1 Tax=Burkholderia phage Momento TaxID=2924902 RepID=A0AAE9G7E2_9CAUD|nr:hypothetical protein CPT_Momento_050 [Burkholderia phage Momento]